MKITHVESYRLGHLLLVAIRTDTGLEGAGESACWAYPEAVESTVSRLAGALIGADPGRIEHHWQTMWRMGPFRSAIVGSAVSALDAALWDLKGKALGVPSHELIGGPYRSRIRLHKAIGGVSADEVAQQARAAADEGFTAVKFDPLGATWIDGTNHDVAGEAGRRLSAILDATGGRVDLIAEVHRSLAPHQIPALLDAVRPFRPLFVEDPIQIDTFDVQTGLLRHGVPLGLGERWQSPWEIREAMGIHGPFVVRSDVNMAGGISAARKIAAIAEAHHAQVSWHNWLGPVADAATLTVDAAIPNVLTHEHVPSTLEHFVGSVETDWRVEEGHMVVPRAPGLGVRVDWDALPDDVDLLGRALHEIPLRSDGSVAFAM